MGCSGSKKISDPTNRFTQKKITKLKDYNIQLSSLVHKKEGNILDVYDSDDKALGTGAFGEVRKAIHKQTGLVRAIKIITKAK